MGICGIGCCGWGANGIMLSRKEVSSWAEASQAVKVSRNPRRSVVSAGLNRSAEGGRGGGIGTR